MWHRASSHALTDKIKVAASYSRAQNRRTRRPGGRKGYIFQSRGPCKRRVNYSETNHVIIPFNLFTVPKYVLASSNVYRARPITNNGAYTYIHHPWEKI
jgi:hypothetical protein